MHPSTVINIEKSKLRNRLYVVYTAGGDTIYIGNHFEKWYTEALGTKQSRQEYYKQLCGDQIALCRSLKAGRTLYETFILNGVSKNIITNINFFNKKILGQIL